MHGTIARTGRTLLALAPAALLLATPACAVNGTGTDSAESQSAVVLTEGEDGATRAVPLGGSVEIRLKAQLGTGYAWTLVKAGPVRQLGDPVTSGGSLAGGWETQSFRLKPTAKGKHVVSFAYARPFDRGAAPAKTVRFTLDVT